MTIKLLSSAVTDLRDGAEFYESQEEGLGGYFLDTLFGDIDSLPQYAGIHVRVHGHFPLLAKRFPFAIYYTVDDDRVVVRRIPDMRRDPRSLRHAVD